MTEGRADPTRPWWETLLFSLAILALLIRTVEAAAWARRSNAGVVWPAGPAASHPERYRVWAGYR